MSRLFRGRKLLAAALQASSRSPRATCKSRRQQPKPRPADEDDRSREVPRRQEGARGFAMSLCKSIDTLAMAYLDDELAARRAPRARSCTSPSARAVARTLDARARRPSACMRAALVAAAGARHAARAARARARRGGRAPRAQGAAPALVQYLLPGSAIARPRPPRSRVRRCVSSRARANGRRRSRTRRSSSSTRPLPLEVQGASTGPWLQQHFASTSSRRSSSSRASQLIGARLLPGGSTATTRPG